jgi:hypothetical protein
MEFACYVQQIQSFFLTRSSFKSDPGFQMPCKWTATPPPAIKSPTCSLLAGVSTALLFLGVHAFEARLQRMFPSYSDTLPRDGSHRDNFGESLETSAVESLSWGSF